MADENLYRARAKRGEVLGTPGQAAALDEHRRHLVAARASTARRWRCASVVDEIRRTVPRS